MTPPNIRDHTLSLSCGSAHFRLIWTPDMTEGDFRDLADWMALIQRQITHLPVAPALATAHPVAPTEEKP